MPVFLETIELTPSTARESLLFLANSFVASSQGDRYIFPAKACLPQHTPEGVMHFRRLDLAAYKVSCPTCAAFPFLHQQCVFLPAQLVTSLIGNASNQHLRSL